VNGFYDYSFSPSLGRKRLFVFLLTNAQLDSDKEKNVVEWFGKCETYSEAMSDEIITAMSKACGAIIFLFELF